MSERILIELLRGGGAHADPVACVEGIPFELTGRTPEGFPHSIWQLVWHMNFWMAYELKRIRGERPPYPEHAAESWPAAAAPRSEEEWRNTVASFRDLLAEFTALAGRPPEFLSQEVAAAHPSHLKIGSSVLALMWQMVAHNSYHIGQVALLRRTLGAWPPAGGGDTW